VIVIEVPDAGDEGYVSAVVVRESTLFCEIAEVLCCTKADRASIRAPDGAALDIKAVEHKAVGKLLAHDNQQGVVVGSLARGDENDLIKGGAVGIVCPVVWTTSIDARL
jgi:hypothetical protein